MRKNIVSPNCNHDGGASPDESSQAPHCLIARERLTPQIPEAVLTPPDQGALSDRARASRMSRLKAAAWVSGDAFHTEVRRQVALYFQEEGADSKGGARVWRKAILLLVWLAASWATFVFTTTGLAATMMIAASAGFAMAGIGFNVQHDGSHRSLSHRRWMNRIAAASLDLLGGSSYIWHWKHNVLHHSSPNVSRGGRGY